MGGWTARNGCGRVVFFAVLAVVATSAVWLATVASAAPSTKYYALTLSPTSAAAGSTQQYTFTLGNTLASTQTLGSANITAPAGITLGGSPSINAPAGLNWSVCLGDGTTCDASPKNVVMIRSASSGDGLVPGSSLTVVVSAGVGCSTGKYTWTSIVKQSNNFNGPPGNGFVNSGSDPSVTVTAGGGPPASFGVSLPGNPFTATAGSPFNATVTAYDVCNNPTPYTGVGALSGSLDPSPNGTQPVYGLVTFSGTSSTSVPVTAYDAEGGRTLTASVPGYPNATSSSFGVVAAAPASLAFATEPNVGGRSDWLLTTSNALTQFATTVGALDPYGNAASAGGNVALTIDPPAGSAAPNLGGTTSQPLTNGVASFTNLTVDQTGVGFTLTATSGNLTAQSTAFNVWASLTACSGSCQSGLTPIGPAQEQVNGNGDFLELGLAGEPLTYTPAGCQTFTPLTKNDVPIVVIDQRSSVSGQLTVVDGANLKDIQKKFSNTKGQQFIPICVGAMRIALGTDGKTHGVPCNAAYPGPNGPIAQATAANPSATGWWGKTLDPSGNFVPYSVSQAVCDPTTGYFFGIVGSFQDYTAPSGDPTIDPSNSPTVTGWGTDPTGVYRNFTIVYPSGSYTDPASAAFANVPWDGFQNH